MVKSVQAGGNQAVDSTKTDRRPSEAQRDSVYANQLKIARSGGDLDTNALAQMFKTDLGSGLISRMRGALQKLGSIASTVAPQEMPEAIELSDSDASQIAAALSQNIVPPKWKDGPWEAADAARSSIDDLAGVLANGAVSLSEESISSILQAIDRQGQKSMGLGGVKDFVAHGLAKIAQAKESVVKSRALQVAAAQELSPNSKTVGDATDIAPGAEVGGKKIAGPGSLFAMMVAEKSGKDSTPSWKLGHEARNAQAQTYHRMNDVGLAAYRGNEEALPVMKDLINAELNGPGTNNAVDLVKMARSGMAMLKADGAIPLTKPMQANLLKGLQDDLRRKLDGQEMLAGHEVSRMVDDLAVAVGWGALGISDAEFTNLVGQLHGTAVEILGERLGGSWDIPGKAQATLEMARAESNE